MGDPVVEANTGFSWDLFTKLSSACKDGGNIFFSPYSISAALAMTLNGARGNTASQMKSVLKFSDMSEEDVNKGFAKLHGVINAADAAYALNTANRIFTQKDYKILEEFLKVTKEHHNAEAVNLDFISDSEGSRKHINDWVEGQTANKIKELMAKDTVDPTTVMVLVNAIYFKGSWEHKFNESKTKKEPFQITKDQSVEVDMMHIYRDYKIAHRQDLECQILQVPYVKEHLSMYILLPNAVDGVSSLEGKLTSSHFHGITKDLRSSKVTFSLPRFKVEQSFSLEETLGAMGMTDLFTAKVADLSGVDGSRELFVSKVIHKAFVEVNEEGTEAAAATAVGMMRCAMPVQINFKVDHPFLFIIRDDRTGSMLFLGRVTNPLS